MNGPREPASPDTKITPFLYAEGEARKKGFEAMRGKPIATIRQASIDLEAVLKKAQAQATDEGRGDFDPSKVTEFGDIKDPAAMVGRFTEICGMLDGYKDAAQEMRKVEHEAKGTAARARNTAAGREEDDPRGLQEVNWPGGGNYGLPGTEPGQEPKRIISPGQAFMEDLQSGKFGSGEQDWTSEKSRTYDLLGDGAFGLPGGLHPRIGAPRTRAELEQIRAQIMAGMAPGQMAPQLAAGDFVARPVAGQDTSGAAPRPPWFALSLTDQPVPTVSDLIPMYDAPFPEVIYDLETTYDPQVNITAMGTAGQPSKETERLSKSGLAYEQRIILKQRIGTYIPVTEVTLRSNIGAGIGPSMYGMQLRRLVEMRLPLMVMNQVDNNFLNRESNIANDWQGLAKMAGVLSRTWSVTDGAGADRNFERTNPIWDILMAKEEARGQLGDQFPMHLVINNFEWANILGQEEDYRYAIMPPTGMNFYPSIYGLTPVETVHFGKPDMGTGNTPGKSSHADAANKITALVGDFNHSACETQGGVEMGYGTIDKDFIELRVQLRMFLILALIVMRPGAFCRIRQPAQV